MTVLSKIKTVILHVPKTGGSSVRWPAMKKHGVRYSCQHGNFECMPDKYVDYRKITFLRNPYDWYASRYFFDKRKRDIRYKKGEPFTDALSEDYKLDFKQTLKRMLNLTETFRKNPAVFQDFKKKMIYEVTNNYTVWWVSYFDDIKSLTPEDFKNLSLYEWFREIIGVKHCDAIYRLEDQYEEGMKKEFGADVNLIHKNKTGRKPSEELYDREMINWVNVKEGKFMREMGYQKW